MGAVIRRGAFWLEAAHPEDVYVNAPSTQRKRPRDIPSIERGMAGIVTGLGRENPSASKRNVNRRNGQGGRKASIPICLRIACTEPHIGGSPSGTSVLSNAGPKAVLLLSPKNDCLVSDWMKKEATELSTARNEAWVRRYQEWNEDRSTGRGQGSYMEWVV